MKTVDVPADEDMELIVAFPDAFSFAYLRVHLLEVKRYVY